MVHSCSPFFLLQPSLFNTDSVTSSDLLVTVQPKLMAVPRNTSSLFSFPSIICTCCVAVFCSASSSVILVEAVFSVWAVGTQPVAGVVIQPSGGGGVPPESEEAAAELSLALIHR